ncbi:hypothetical protein SAMN05421736_1493 [Evansella caseinilytica]|uniref:Uncharacterized protein n=1 Tax=Evansella caseinilytica TaxID=1503961 RepID=A0A1H3V4Z5_9BACI|nr:hypothetical protein [Evansella caseinilytica]SDZ69129.1 hypothetical protein SAMN05421736_1493 [Evansella caseinilytica]
MIEKAEDQVNKTSFTEAEHQLISMKISYKAEEYVPLLREASNQAELNDLLNGMLEEYRVALDDLNIKFVEGVPQYFESTIPTMEKK